MNDPWAVRKIAHPLTPDRDIDPNAPKHEAQLFDTLVGNCITRVTEALERQIPSGYDDLQRDHLCAVFESMRAMHKSLRGLLKNEIHPSSVDALCLARAQLETLYAICYMVEKPTSVTDFLKNDWKSRYIRFLLKREETKRVPRFQAYVINEAGPRWPRIDFNYFAEGSDRADDDLKAVFDGVQFVREMNKHLGAPIDKEIWPGKEYATEARLKEFIKNEAWGHHASCTNKIGTDDDKYAVLDSKFRVRGTDGLRVVDASVFPKIPGYFIVSAIYMISEKASDVIIEDAQRKVR